MNALKKFEEYLEKGIIQKIPPEKNRADFLLSSSDKLRKALLERIKLIGITDLQAESIIKEVYDLLMDRIRAKMLVAGYRSIGLGAHESEVAYLQKLNFNDNEISFMDKLRYIRNGIMYYGKQIDKEYAKKVIDFMEKVRERLK